MAVLNPQTVKDIADRLEGKHSKEEDIGDIVQRMGGIKWSQHYYTKDLAGASGLEIENE